MRLLIVRNRATKGGKELLNEFRKQKVKTRLSVVNGPVRNRPMPPKVYIVNWGCADIVRFPLKKVLNHPDKIKKFSNKYLFFKEMLDKARVPQWWVSKEEAQVFLDGHKSRKVMVRKVLNGHSGIGCQVVSHGEKLPDAPLYVKFIAKTSEYRVHCFNIKGKIVVSDVQKKRAKTEKVNNGLNYQIKNLSNGWIYARDNVAVPEDVKKQAMAAFAVTGLDFGAVDVIWNPREDNAYVLEVNTAPGLEGKTVELYVENIRSMVQ